MNEHVGILPKQYDPKSIENEVRDLWERKQIYNLVKKTKSSDPKFYFLDGPPFPSSDTPHIGTCWNKVLKDTVIRYKRASGFNVRDQPGYDCHGLPIELAIEQRFGAKTKKDIESFGLEKFVSACKQFAEDNSASMQAGLYYGYVDMVDGILDRMKKVLGPRTKVVATGAKRCKKYHHQDAG